MSALRTVAQEVLGLFVDSGAFAVAILAWVLLVGLALAWLGLAHAGIVLFVGLAAILVESVVRQARRTPGR